MSVLRLHILVVLVGVTLFVAAACTAPGYLVDLTAGDWKVISVNDQSPPPGLDPKIVFSMGGKIVVDTGCAQLKGTYFRETDSDAIAVHLQAVEPTCPQPDSDFHEKLFHGQFVDALGRVTNWSVDSGSRVQLHGDPGQPVLIVLGR
jgi:hypothetical protein